MEQDPDLHTTVRLLLARKSVREGYREREVSEELLRTIVSCGLAAPSSKNGRPWRLHVVTSRTILAELADKVAGAKGAGAFVPHDPLTGEPWPQWKSTVRESAHVLRSVACGIFVENTGTFSRGRSTLGTLEPERLSACLFAYGLEMVGVGAAVMNMWTAANSLGLAAAFMGDVCVAESAISERLGIDGDLVGVLCLGYGDLAEPSKVSPQESVGLVAWHP